MHCRRILIAAILSLPAFVGLLDTQAVLVKTDSQLISQQADAYLAQKASRNPVFARALKESDDRLAAKGWKKVPGGAMVLREPFLASIAESICPTLGAQASDGLGCNAGARTLTRAFMKQGFLRLRDNASWVLGGAASAGVFGGGPVGFLGTLGITGGAVILDGYVGEFNRFMSRCTTR